MTTLVEAIEQADQELKLASETHLLDAQVLLAHVLGKPRAWILAHPEYMLSSEEDVKFTHSLDELKSGAALPYVIGHWEFYGLDFCLTPDVLIPRPETELLVEKAIHWLHVHPGQRWAVDVGTGSGSIAVTLATKVVDLTIIASDISYEALRVARSNALMHGVRSRIHLVQASLLPPTCRGFDLICANLPYVPTNILKTLDVFRREPALALDGGVDGFDMIRGLLEECCYRISPRGCIFLEIEASQGRLVKEMAERFFPYGNIRIWPDLAGRERLLEINMIK